MKEAIKGDKTYAQIVQEASIKMSVRTLQWFLRKCSDARRGRPLPLSVDISTSLSDDDDDDEDNSDAIRRERDEQHQPQPPNMNTGVS